MTSFRVNHQFCTLTDSPDIIICSIVMLTEGPEAIYLFHSFYLLFSTGFSGQSGRLLYTYPSAIPLYLSLFMCISRHLIPQTSVLLHRHSAQFSGMSSSNIALAIVFDLLYINPNYRIVCPHRINFTI